MRLVHHEEALVEQRRDRGFLHHHFVQRSINGRAAIDVDGLPGLFDLPIELRRIEIDTARGIRVAVEEDIEEIVGVGNVGVPVGAEDQPVTGLLQGTPRFGRRMRGDVDLNADRLEILDDASQQA